jgi:hypothetical protein
MALQYKAAKTPGPIGGAPDGLGGRFPGPIGARFPDPFYFKTVDLSSTATKAAAKTFEMPAPAGGTNTILLARAVDWDLSKDSPLTEDIKQGEVGTCPIAAILAAMANTPTGKIRINSLITEYTRVPIKTTFSKEILDFLNNRLKVDRDNKPPKKEILSKRYFSVNLSSPVEVSDVFYIKYTDGSDVEMVYTGSNKDALWPAVIEKAFAVQFGSYEELGIETKHSANEYWNILVGAPPQVLAIDKKSDLGKISAIAKAAGQVPAIGASKDDATLILNDHGFAILGIQGSKLQLYDPEGHKESISLEDFRHEFKAILSGKPKG